MDWVPLIAHPTTFEAKKSQFCSLTESLRDPGEVVLILQNARDRWPGANHYVYAYRLPAGLDKAHDDGEPHGTAGLPILNLLTHRNLSHVMVVVARYFGGIKLGHGGLVHAYQKSAQLALDHTEWGQLVETLDLTITLRYPDYDTVRRILDPLVSQVTTEFLSEIHASFRVPASAWPALEIDLLNATHGAVRIQSTTPGWDVLKAPD